MPQYYDPQTSKTIDCTTSASLYSVSLNMRSKYCKAFNPESRTYKTSNIIYWKTKFYVLHLVSLHTRLIDSRGTNLPLFYLQFSQCKLKWARNNLLRGRFSKCWSRAHVSRRSMRIYICVQR